MKIEFQLSQNIKFLRRFVKGEDFAEVWGEWPGGLRRYI